MKKTKLAKPPMNKKDMKKYYGVMYKNKLNMVLSPALAIKQQLTQEDLEELKRLHVERLVLFDWMEKEKNVNTLRKQVKVLQKIEFAMQKAWKFTQDARFHTWWFRAPKCLCPKMDNEDSLGTGFNTISEDCPLHGKETGKMMKVIRK